MVFQANPNPLPPTHINSTRRISPSDAHAFLSAYLDRAATDPSYQPDSTLSAHGPVSANTGSAPNLVIHSLKRVCAGLGGEVLGRDIVLEQQLQQGDQGAKNFTDGEDWGGKPKGKKAPAGEKRVDGWQDLESFEREQLDLVDGGDGDEEENVGPTVAEENVGVEDYDIAVKEATIDKEERKRKKKERRKAEQRARASAAS
ncbi:uncharacterized protein CIMG_09553 [Coccidioides immitis RS]|uniref:Uncharacterized protein n=3 Tax=Coccidioides immitis TaxID=5501 RepID=A0A0E1RUU4_COCIM|nr:uncharacterized protein CIMG_09553 [Coccidioides immitis RS]EAS28349.1 hypothetical protein CIMG_09553 [Coccidioides immitis RS]KMP09195.1 hypothetical protein CIRG_08876 [Coccidioides immitis RMSCC 2394]KMU85995.1 hypothetical protein CIHG_03525 [Coccidioides immitis H538.4]TPX20981.1 hypothetical protein DIZ76_016878 [Coccidioides immitis]